MSIGRRLRVAGLVLAMVAVASGCEYWGMAKTAQDNGQPVPWFCDPVAPNSVTLSGMGTVNWYAGTTREPLSYADCRTVGQQFDQAKAYAVQYPTLQDAVNAGFRSTFAFIPGMGTHHGLQSITPELLADPSFDRFNPIIPNSVIDDVFDPAQPEFLQYNGNGPTARLVGMSYYVRTEQRAAARGLRRQQRLVAPPPDAVPRPHHRGGVVAEHQRQRLRQPQRRERLPRRLLHAARLGGRRPRVPRRRARARCTRASSRAGPSST